MYNGFILSSLIKCYSIITENLSKTPETEVIKNYVPAENNIPTVTPLLESTGISERTPEALPLQNTESQVMSTEESPPNHGEMYVEHNQQSEQLMKQLSDHFEDQPQKQPGDAFCEPPKELPYQSITQQYMQEQHGTFTGEVMETHDTE